MLKLFFLFALLTFVDVKSDDDPIDWESLNHHLAPGNSRRVGRMMEEIRRQLSARACTVESAEVIVATFRMARPIFRYEIHFLVTFANMILSRSGYMSAIVDYDTRNDEFRIVNFSGTSKEISRRASA